MLFWNLLHSNAVQGIAHFSHNGKPPDFLSAPERVQFAGYRLPKRRADWLLGRYAMKGLVRAYLLRTAPGRAVPADPTLTIANAEDGAPFALFAGSGPLPITIRISHRAGTALVALSPEPDAPLGADLELIESRADSFAETYFTEAEQRQVALAPPEARDRIVTELWSLKETGLKALREGLRADTRSVEATARARDSSDWELATLTTRLSPSPAPAFARTFGNLVATVAHLGWPAGTTQADLMQLA